MSFEDDPRDNPNKYAQELAYEEIRQLQAKLASQQALIEQIEKNIQGVINKYNLAWAVVEDLNAALAAAEKQEGK